jgi:hypothetical protein
VAALPPQFQLGWAAMLKSEKITAQTAGRGLRLGFAA